jgi:ABC-2 type transport system permease protein
LRDFREPCRAEHVLVKGRPRDAIDYVWIAQALIMPVYFWNWWEIANTIRTGDVVSDLAKPVDYYAFWLSRDTGRTIYHTLLRWLPTMLLGVLLFNVHLPAEPGRWLRFRRDETTAAELIAAVSARYRIRDLTIEEPEIESIVCRLYEEGL